MQTSCRGAATERPNPMPVALLAQTREIKLGATARSFAILEHVARARTPVDVLDIISSLKLPKATAYRLVDWFITQGYLSREPGRKRLIVGPKLATLAFGALSSSMRNDAPHVVLQRLVHALNETCNIGTLLNGEVIYLDRVEAEHWPLRLQYTSGSRVPLHCSAIGKLYLALAPTPRRRRLLQSLELRRFTDHTITEGGRLDAELRQIRKEQVSFDREEYLAGVVCMAVPVIGRNGETARRRRHSGAGSAHECADRAAPSADAARRRRRTCRYLSGQRLKKYRDEISEARKKDAAMKMTTEEAFVKVLQMHGIEHAFGIIGSAFMPISDLFPKAGITFWDVAHEGNGGLICDGYTRSTGKIAMAIAQNGPGITNFVTADQDRLLEPHADAAGDAAGGEQDDRSGRLPGSGADGAVPRHGLLSGRGARSLARCRGAQSRHHQGQAPVGAGADQHPARLLDAGHRHQPAGDRRIRASGRRRPGDRGSGQAAVGGEIPGHPVGRRRRARQRDPGMRRAGREARCAGLQQLPAQRQLPRQPSAGRRSARL